MVSPGPTAPQDRRQMIPDEGKEGIMNAVDILLITISVLASVLIAVFMGTASVIRTYKEACDIAIEGLVAGVDIQERLREDVAQLRVERDLLQIKVHDLELA